MVNVHDYGETTNVGGVVGGLEEVLVDKILSQMHDVMRRRRELDHCDRMVKRG